MSAVFLYNITNMSYFLYQKLKNIIKSKQSNLNAEETEKQNDETSLQNIPTALNNSYKNSEDRDTSLDFQEENESQDTSTNSEGTASDTSISTDTGAQDSLNTQDDENEFYNPSSDNILRTGSYDPGQASYQAFLETGKEAYINGNRFLPGTEEHKLWASIHEPERYKNNVSPFIRSLSVYKTMKKFDNQNNQGKNQYVNPDVSLPEVSNALNTTAPVAGSFSTSKMEQKDTPTGVKDYNAESNNANPTGENGKPITPKKENSSTITNTTVSSNVVNINEKEKSSLKFDLTDGVINNIKKNLLKSFDVEETEKTLQVANDGYIEEDPNELPLSAEKEKEIEQFFQPDDLTQKIDQKPTKQQELLTSLNSLSTSEAIFKDIKNARKYAKIYNTKIASHNEKAYVVTPTLKDINMFGKRIFKVDIKKY